MSWFVGLWPLFWHFGIAALVVAACAAGAIYFRSKTLMWLAVLVTLTTIAWGAGVRDGEKRVIKQWEAAKQAEFTQGEELRSDAERTVARDTPDSVRNDPRNRDNWK